MNIHDGHVHTPYCPHGTLDSLAAYCEKAIQLGRSGITFTEHAPLPANFNDPTPKQDSAMKHTELTSYIDDINVLKKEYSQQLTIFTGLEIDFIVGYEEETEALLAEFGPFLDDSILSVHFLKIKDNYLCLDYSPEVFAEAVNRVGSVDRLHQLYYETVLKSVTSHLGTYKPKRIGHMTLVQKFSKRFPTEMSHLQIIKSILNEMKTRGYSLDYNGAGVIKPLCKEPYPFYEVIELAQNMNIPLVYGSDAHQVKELSNGFEQILYTNLLLTSDNLYRKQ
ncbi:histidinol-phosphatase HisJ [Bacillus sp. JCM 19034]|uniref:histidinol-phosphatase HisJ n=1 Tax=Bacillus sp. JCM 19034 TaxID=1481928 RepID=UPI000A481BBF|nr:histidinol-phosphatase HisJ [Bacillus sp. JCM 19034]